MNRYNGTAEEAAARYAKSQVTDRPRADSNRESGGESPPQP
jgi:hypothetical protein